MIQRSKAFNGLNVTFNTTEDCNLACTYCYEVNKLRKTLALVNAKKFIDVILSDPDPIGTKGTDEAWMTENGIILDFLGGDALMTPELVGQIIDYFQERAWALNHNWKARWRASISTNGTLFDRPAVREFMEKYGDNLSIGVSVDGCPAIHDLNRIFVDGRGTMSTILSQWDYYIDWCSRHGCKPSVKATLNRESIPYLFESVVYLFETLNMSDINMNFIMENMELRAEDLVVLDDQLSKVKNYLIPLRNQVYLSMFDPNMGCGKPMSEDETSCKGKCGSGAMPALGINGKIYPCFRYLPHTAVKGRDDFNVGNVKDGFNRKDRFNKVREATRQVVSSDKCKGCPIESSCNYCIGGCYAEFGEFRRTEYICEATKLQDKWAKIYWREYDKLEGTHTENAYYDTWEEWNAKRVV
jgi:uncharacterized protein